MVMSDSSKVNWNIGVQVRIKFGVSQLFAKINKTESNTHIYMPFKEEWTDTSYLNSYY